MESERLPRKLAAVLYADLAGYSRATGEDEDGAHRLLSDSLDRFAAEIARHGGRVVHYAGDALLATFAAAVDALRTADAIQAEIATRNASLPQVRRIEFRIGVNLGDVIEDRGDVYGNGVNVAARLATLGDAGGICVSDSVRIAVGQKLPLRYESIGEQFLKNITEPVRAYRVVRAAALPGVTPLRARSAGGKRLAYATMLLIAAAGALVAVRFLPTNESPIAAPVNAPAAADRTAASVAVLPFVNSSSDPDQEYLGDGVAEELLNALANIEGLRVPSQTSSFKFKETDTDLRTIAAALNVDHVLEGSVRKAGNRVRITAQLVDVATDTQVWSDRYEKELTDVFAIQDEIATNVATVLRLKLLGPGPVGARTANVEAHDALLRGLHYLRTQRSEDIEKAIESLQHAIDLDPDYAIAHATLSKALMNAQIYGHMPRDAAIARARPGVERALELAPDLAEVHQARAQLAVFSGDFAAAETELRRAIALNSNLAMSYGLEANLFDRLDRPAETRAALEKAIGLDPLNAFLTWAMGTLLLNVGEMAEAGVYYRRALELEPNQPNAYAGLGDLAIFQGHLDEGLRWYLRGLERDPRQPHMTAAVGYIYRSLGDLERAQQWLDRAAALLEVGSVPRFFREYSRLVARREDPHELLAILAEIPADQMIPLSPRLFRKAALATGDAAGSEAFLRHYWPELFAAEPQVTSWNAGAATDVAWVLIRAGRTREATALLERALALFRDRNHRSMQPLDWAFDLVETEALALEDRKADALAALQRSVDTDWRMDWWQVETDPALASIRDDPQFAAALARVRTDVEAQLTRVRELERNGTIPAPQPVP